MAPRKIVADIPRLTAHRREHARHSSTVFHRLQKQIWLRAGKRLPIVEILYTLSAALSTKF
jgi:hypothetical protein